MSADCDGLWARIASEIWSPTLCTGLSDVIGSWNTIAISPPRILRNSSIGIFSRSRPLYNACPPAIRPGGCGIRPRIESVLTLLPEPDSPTTPSVSPGATS